MASTEKQRSDYISNIRQASRDFMESVNLLRDLNHQHTDTDIANDLSTSDFVGDNAGLAKADILAILTTLGNIETMLAAGNGTNLSKVK